MKIIHKNDGIYIPYTLTQNKLKFDGKLTIRLNEYESDEPVHIDISLDKNDVPILGIIPDVSVRYAAEIDIPAREYKTEITGENILTEGQSDGEPIETSVPIEFNPDNITLTLWGLEE